MRRFTVSGTSFRVLAIDGHDLNGPGLLDRVRLPLAAGGRYDIGFAMPSGGVTIGLEGTGASLQLSSSGENAPPLESTPTADFDPLDYGEPAPTPFSRSSRFDRSFELTITKKLGFFDGRPGRHWALNGGIYPDVPMFVVERGDLVRVTIANDTNIVHPMHLHGHHALVLSRNGQPATGSPWWTDTLDVDPATSTRSPSVRTTLAYGWITATTSAMPPPGSRCTSSMRGSRRPSSSEESTTTRPSRARRRQSVRSS